MWEMGIKIYRSCG